MGLTPYDPANPPTRTSMTAINDAGATDGETVESMAMVLVPPSGMSKKRQDNDDEGGNSGTGKKQPIQLPSPKVIAGKDVPFTTYASKTFQMAGVATSNTLHIDRSTALLLGRSRKEFDGGPDFQSEDGESEEDDGGTKGDAGDGWVPCDEKACSRGKEKKADDDAPVNDYSHNDDSDGLHLPAGQHLLVDIKDVDSNFLNSEERLAHAMIELINESKLTLLSYHCHSLVPVGVSCAGVLLESHVAFHTWPMEGVITMDLFTCGGGLLIPTLPSIEKLFGVPSAPSEGEDPEDVPKPTLLWSHKLRGFREGFAPGYVRSKNPLDGSLGRHVLGKLDFDLKRPLLSTKTAIQSVNIYEVMEPKSRDINAYYESLASPTGTPTEDSYEATNPESFGPNKILFLDDVVQSTSYGDAAYHESIVHPSMMAHSNPQRVAILGGGEGAALREVLKHKSVAEVVVLEIDEELVSICAEYMPQWSDCSDIEGSGVASCFEDERARVVYGDAFQWFIDNFGKVDKENEEEKFDVIIMDALDPYTSVEIAGGLYNGTSFVDSLFNGLSEDGVFVVQLGKSKMSTDPPDEVGRFKDTALMIEALDESGFESIHTYAEGHSGFYMPWSYLVAFKEYGTKANWQRPAPQMQIELYKRLQKTKSGKPILKYFDAETMMRYQLPPKAVETLYCRQDEHPYECDYYVGFDPAKVNNCPASECLKVEKSRISEFAGRGLIAARDIPESTALAVEGSAQQFSFPPFTFEVVQSMSDWASMEGGQDNLPLVKKEYNGFYTFIPGYGYGSILLGKIHYAVESDIMLFANHGCNGSFNYGFIESEDGEIKFTESNIDLDNAAEIMEHFTSRPGDPYSPVLDRNWRHSLNSGDYILRDVKEGEEILCDYLSFVGYIIEFKEEVLSLRAQCAGEGVGVVTEYESESS